MPAKQATSQPPKTHPIQVVARRTGLTPDVIRVWERRYHAVSPQRAKGKRRLYTDEEVDRLLLLRKLTRSGRRIGDVAALSDDELRVMVAEDDRAAAAAADVAGPMRPRARGKQDVLEECFQAIEAMDGEALESALLGASMEMSETELIDRVIIPLMHEVGERWHDGSLRIMHEHMASAVVRSVLSNGSRSRMRSDNAPVAVVTTPAGQLHEMGALMVALNASREGWNVVYLGPNIPADEVAAAAMKRKAKLVALSIVYPMDDPLVAEGLRRLRKLIGDDIPILAGGRGASGYATVLNDIGAVNPGSLKDLRAMLEELRLKHL
jgi:methanogenic corrinoid protein MtbC1